MAFTVSTIVKTNMGNQKVLVLNITADGAEANITTGMKVINFIGAGYASAATNPNVRMNADSTGTASNGILGMSACTSGNIYEVIVYGR